MFTDVHKVAGEILDLLKTRAGPVSIKEVNGCTAASMGVINMSIGMLVREDLIIIERKDGENFIRPVLTAVDNPLPVGEPTRQRFDSRSESAGGDLVIHHEVSSMT